MSDLPASRELDALVAEKVMGFSVRRSNVDVQVEVAGAFFFGWDWECSGGDDPDGTRRLLPAYSTSIAAAWEVALKVGALDLCQHPLEDYWVAFFRGRGESTLPGKDLVAAADTAPLAICRAAMKAVEGVIAISAPPQGPT